jgi:zinc D-Ala-D-Ala dipeptidase
MGRVKRRAIFLIGALIVLSILLGPDAGPCSAGENIPEGFVDVKKVVPSIVLDIRYSGPHNFVGERVDGYKAPKCILTQQAAEALSRVQDLFQQMKNEGQSQKRFCPFC